MKFASVSDDSFCNHELSCAAGMKCRVDARHNSCLGTRRTDHAKGSIDSIGPLCLSTWSPPARWLDVSAPHRGEVLRLIRKKRFKRREVLVTRSVFHTRTNRIIRSFDQLPVF